MMSRSNQALPKAFPKHFIAILDTMEYPTVALITGANGGIGRAVAEFLAADHHYHVVIGSRSLAAGQDVADSLKSRGLLLPPIFQKHLASSMFWSTTPLYTLT